MTSLAALLAVEPAAAGAWRPSVHPGLPGSRGRLYGGLVAAHALAAAASTVPDGRLPHSLHSHFLHSGSMEHRPHLRVERTRDGGSFSTRRVEVLQEGSTILIATASFHDPEPGAVFAVPAAQVPAPEGAAVQASPAGRAHAPLDVVELAWDREPPEPPASWSTRRIWVRPRMPLTDDAVLHACALVYVSDLGTLLAPERAVASHSPVGMHATLDHTVWLHRPRCDGWVLIDLRPTGVAGARGVTFGTMHAADGLLLASLAQEALLRPARREA
jgi:acyl-CoA thioesterase-2